MTPGLTLLAEGSDSGIVTARRSVVRDAGSWRALWAAHAGPGSPAPVVDFTSRVVAAVFAGERPSPGHAVEITDAREDAGTLTLAVTEHRPPRGSVAPQLLVSPFHIVTLPRFDGEIRFADAAEPGTSTPDTIPAPKRSSSVRTAPALDNTVPSSTGLDPNFAAALSYLAGPVSGVLILLVERANRYVRFHAWQSVLGLGSLALLAAAALLFSFLTLLLSPLAFTAMFRLSEVAAVVWLLAWVWCLVQAFTGRAWRMPVAGRHAERLATRPLSPSAR
jgi:uncharacterized membrane protein